MDRNRGSLLQVIVVLGLATMPWAPALALAEALPWCAHF